MGAFDDLIPKQTTPTDAIKPVQADQTALPVDQKSSVDKSLSRKQPNSPDNFNAQDNGFSTGITEAAMGALGDLFKASESIRTAGIQALRGKKDVAKQDASTALNNVFGGQPTAQIGDVYREMGLKDQPIGGSDLIGSPIDVAANIVQKQPAATAGLATDLVTDPLNLVGLGAGKQVVKAGAEVVAKQAAEVAADAASTPFKRLNAKLAARADKEAAEASKDAFKTADIDLAGKKTFDDFETQIKDKQAQMLEIDKNPGLDDTAKQTAKAETAQEVDGLKYEQVVSEMSDFDNDITKRTIFPNPNPLTSLVQTYISNKGQFGGALYRQLERASNIMDGARAKWLTAFEPRGNLPAIFGKLNKDQHHNFFAAMEGFEEAADPAVKHLVDIAKANRTDIAEGAIKRGVQVKTGNNSTSKFFSIRENHMPHNVISPKQVLTRPDILDDSLAYGVRTGRFDSIEEAKQVWDAYADASKKNVDGIEFKPTEKNQKFFDWIVKNKQAEDVPQAVKRFQDTVRTARTPKAGSLEAERSLDIPFFDVQGDRVLSRYYSSVGKRFGEIDSLGRNNEIANQLINGIKGEFGDKDAERVTKMVNLMTGGEKPSDLGSDFAGMLRDVEAARKLSLAVFMNLTQTVNTAAVTGVVNTNKALLQAISKEGRDFAYKSGVLFSEMARSMYGASDDLITSKAVDGILKATGFSEVERSNRIVAAIAGKHFAKEQSMKYIASNGANETSARALRNMGLNPDSILRRGSLTDDETLSAVRNLVNRTQFRSRILDSPEWAASPWGKVVNQFKNYSENQVKFLREEVINEAKQGNWGPALRYVSLAPPAYAGAKALKDKIRGKDSRLDTRTNIQKIAEIAANMGTMGMYYDILMSMNFKREGWVASLVPAADTLGKGGSAALEAVKPIANRVLGEPEARYLNLKPLAKFGAESIPVFGNRVKDALKTPEDKQKEASRLINEATSRGLDVNRLIEGLRADPEINIAKAIKGAKTGSKHKKKANAKLTREAAVEGNISKLLGL